MAKSQYAFEFKKLHKQYGKKTAVDAVSLAIPAGSFFGIVGPNGAGKTTTLSMATGLLVPDSGSAEIFGHNVWTERNEAMTLVGMLPDGLALPEHLTGREVLLYIGLLRGMKKAIVEQRADELLALLELDSEMTTLIMEYSTGMRKKIGLAMALLHNPKLVVLDEPLEAVDPVSSLSIKKMLTNYVKHGGTVVFSSHVMPVVEQLCNSIAIMHKGKILTAGSIEDITDGKSLEERFITMIGSKDAKDGALSWLAS